MVLREFSVLVFEVGRYYYTHVCRNERGQKVKKPETAYVPAGSLVPRHPEECPAASGRPTPQPSFCGLQGSLLGSVPAGASLGSMLQHLDQSFPYLHLRGCEVSSSHVSLSTKTPPTLFFVFPSLVKITTHRGHLINVL